MAKIRDVIQHIQDEETDTYSDDSLFSISSWGADLSFRELIERYEEDSLVKPELQRNYVWDRIEASRFIDSLLLGLPVPSIFLAQTSDERLLIIDGFQRIMTVYDFVRGIFSQDGKVFRLSKSKKINERWGGKAFAELADAEQRRIRNTTIHAIIFVQQHPVDGDTSLFQVFERINTSGRTLMAQEIRNCVAQGPFNTLLFELNQLPEWRRLFGLNVPDSRMRDMEFILRFFALSSRSFSDDVRERISLKQFLDLYMKSNANPPADVLESFRNRFLASTRLILESYGPAAFQNISPTDPNRLVPKFRPTIYDSMIIAADRAISEGTVQIPVRPEDARRHLLQDEHYRFAITKETMTRNCITTRINMAYAHLFGVEHAQP